MPINGLRSAGTRTSCNDLYDCRDENRLLVNFMKLPIAYTQILNDLIDCLQEKYGYEKPPVCKMFVKEI